MKIIVKTNWGFSESVELPVVPRIGESIVVSDMTELYNDECGQSPRWVVTDVVYNLERAESSMNDDIIYSYPIVVEIKNEEDLED